MQDEKVLRVLLWAGGTVVALTVVVVVALSIYLSRRSPGTTVMPAGTISFPVPFHRGLVWNLPFSALAHLQLGRAFAIQGDAPKARAAYQDFLMLWRDADPDIPILKQAKLEYARLQ